MDERTSDAIYCKPSGNIQGGFFVYKFSTAQVVHMNTTAIAHSNDTVMRQVEAITANEKMQTALLLEIVMENNTILDFDTDHGSNREDDISDDEYSDHDDQIEDDHSL